MMGDRMGWVEWLLIAVTIGLLIVFVFCSLKARRLGVGGTF